MGMFGPKYVWLLFASLGGSWIFRPHMFKTHYKTVKCNVTMISQAAEGFIIIDKVVIRQDNNKTISGMVRISFVKIFILQAILW